MFGINFIKIQPTTYLLQYRGGKIVREGLGLSFFYYAPTTSLVAVRVVSADVPFIFQFKTMDANHQWVMNDDTDNVVLVNSVFNGLINSPAQVVRYRILNASSHRVFRFGFSNNLSFNQITSDDGLLNAPIVLTRMNLSPGERAEILVDLSGLQAILYIFKPSEMNCRRVFQGGLQAWE